MIKDLETAKLESTCQKRITICEIYDAQGNLLSRESNRCSPEGECHRLGVLQDKENYDETSDCNWVHAEIMAIKALPDGAKPTSAVLKGHDFICTPCEKALWEVGVRAMITSSSLD